MNIKKGDIVQHKMYSKMQGIVVRVGFSRFHQGHVVVFHGGHGYLKYREPKFLRVIRRKK